MDSLHNEIYAVQVLKVIPTGSRIICNPAPLDTDEDYVVLVEDLAIFTELATLEGWTNSSDTSGEPSAYGSFDGDLFTCFRKGHFNLIVTNDEHFFERWAIATGLAQRLNLTKKEDRIALFKVVVDEEWAALTHNDNVKEYLRTIL